MSKYAIYKLGKVAGKNRYIPEADEICQNLTAARECLQIILDDIPDGPMWVNPKTGEFETYTMRDDMLFIPNWDPDKDKETPYRRYPIYIIDKYPSPYTYYKEKAYFESFIMVGVKE